MNTITKAVIKNKVVNSNKYYVEIPYLQQSSVNNNGITESALEATLAHTPGIVNSYNEGDVVFVSFEDTLASKPVILGKLLLDENENRGYAKLNSLDVIGKVSLSKDVTIGDYTVDELLTNAVNSIKTETTLYKHVMSMDAGLGTEQAVLVLITNNSNSFANLSGRLLIAELHRRNHVNFEIMSLSGTTKGAQILNYEISDNLRGLRIRFLDGSSIVQSSFTKVLSDTITKL